MPKVEVIAKAFGQRKDGSFFYPGDRFEAEDGEVSKRATVRADGKPWPVSKQEKADKSDDTVPKAALEDAEAKAKEAEEKLQAEIATLKQELETAQAKAEEADAANERADAAEKRLEELDAPKQAGTEDDPLAKPKRKAE